MGRDSWTHNWISCKERLSNILCRSAAARVSRTSFSWKGQARIPLSFNLPSLFNLAFRGSSAFSRLTKILARAWRLPASESRSSWAWDWIRSYNVARITAVSCISADNFFLSSDAFIVPLMYSTSEVVKPRSAVMLAATLKGSVILERARLEQFYCWWIYLATKW